MQAPGTIYKNGKRYWWAVTLPGEKKRKFMPLIPDGGSVATNDIEVARAIAANKWAEITRVAEMPDTSIQRPTIAELAAVFKKHLKLKYPTTSTEPREIGYAVDAMAGSEYGHWLVELFTPKNLKTFRASLVKDGKWCRKLINRRIRRVQNMFTWAASENMIPASTAGALMMVKSLSKSEAVIAENSIFRPFDNEKVKPVDVKWIDETAKYCTQIIKDMMHLHLYTGMRSGELVRMKWADIDTSGAIWKYTPSKPDDHHVSHKTDDDAHTKVIPIGPKGQAILETYRYRGDKPIFSAAESREQRFKMMRDAARKPSHQIRRKTLEKMLRPPVDYFKSDTYGQAVAYAIAKAKRNGATEMPDWHPHQIRHTAATIVRRELSRDHARSLLGHAHTQMTDNYAEIDEKLATEAARKLG